MNNPKTKEVDRLLQFILATAGREDDFRERELGPIHLIKYLYLADLAYAEEHDGETYTGIRWKFHHFGPWSTQAYERIEPALREIGATCKTLPSKYEEDMVRWTIRDDDLYRRLWDELPNEVARSVRKYVHQFDGITEDLLHFVYNTVPMLKGRPGSLLDMTAASQEKHHETQAFTESLPATKKSYRLKAKKEEKRLSTHSRNAFRPVWKPRLNGPE